MCLLEVKELTHLYDNRTTDGVSNITFELFKSQMTALIGPSGSGKSTTLNCIKNQFPAVHFKEDVSIGSLDIHSKLDQSLDVFDNLRKELNDLNDDQAQSQIRTVLSQLEITNEIHSRPQELSGGQTQRVLIAKALINNPTLLLLDEPFANLDRNLRELLIKDLKEIVKESELSVLWVTHNTEEALKYSDKIILMNYGKIEQIGSAYDLYNQPANIFVAQFFGENNILAATQMTESQYELLGIKFEGNLKQKNSLAMIRPHQIQIQADSKMIGKIVEHYFLGSNTLLKVRHKDVILYIETVSSKQFKSDENVGFSISNTAPYIVG